MMNYLNDHLYIYIGEDEIDNRFFPFNLKQYGFIYNTTEIIPQYTYGGAPDYFFQLNDSDSLKFFTSFYKLTETNTKYNIQIDTIYVASETDLSFDDRYISKTPNTENSGSTIYFYYKTGNYDGITTLIIYNDFPTYENGGMPDTFYFVRKNRKLPENGMELLSDYTVADNVITFDDGEKCNIIKCEIFNYWKDNNSETNPELGDILFSVKIEISK